MLFRATSSSSSLVDLKIRNRCWANVQLSKLPQQRKKISHFFAPIPRQNAVHCTILYVTVRGGIGSEAALRTFRRERKARALPGPRRRELSSGHGRAVRRAAAPGGGAVPARMRGPSGAAGTLPERSGCLPAAASWHRRQSASRPSAASAPAPT